jgi:hypothetical protein
VTSIIHNSEINLQASYIKSYEHVLIMKACLAVSEKQGMPFKLVESDVFSEFESADKDCVIPVSLKGMS